MNGLAVLLTLVLLAAVMAVVSRPLLSARKPDESDTPEQAELEAAREAKYREIRDTELDYRTGKLSGEDYQSVNSALRTEAVEILDRLDSLGHEATDEQQEATGEQQEATGERSDV